jgi:pilus assembly protein CpaB
MNQRLLSVLAFAFIVSAGASLLLYRLLSGRLPTQSVPGRTKLVLAARNLDPGTLIRDADIRESEWNGKIPEGVVQKREEISGRGVISPIMADEPFVESRLAPKGGGAGLAALIPKGMRAVAIRVNEIVGVAGFVGPGMRVDVLVSGSPPGGSSVGSLTKTLLQNVEVLSAGQNFQKDAEGKPVSVQVVNLLVTPEQAEKLSLASNQTTIQLVLRNPLDDQIAKTPGSALAQIFQPEMALPGNMRLGAPAPPAAVSPAAHGLPILPRRAPERVVEVFHGAKRTDIQFVVRPEVQP